jgi:hypothetical protein
MNSKFEIMPPEVQAMIMQAAQAKVASIIDGKIGLREQAEALIERLAGDSSYLLKAYKQQIETNDLRSDNPRHVAKLEDLKQEALAKAKIAIAEDVLRKPLVSLQYLNENHADSKYSEMQLEKMAKVVNLIGSSKIDYALVKNDKPEQNDGAASGLGASLARTVAMSINCRRKPRKKSRGLLKTKTSTIHNHG